MVQLTFFGTIVGYALIYASKHNTGFSQLFIFSIIWVLGGLFILYFAFKFLCEKHLHLFTFILELFYILFTGMAAFYIIYLPVILIILFSGKVFIGTKIIFFGMIIAFPLISLFNMVAYYAQERDLKVFDYIIYRFNRKKRMVEE